MSPGTRSRSLRAKAPIVLVFATLLAASAHAHGGLEPGVLQMQLVRDTAYVTITPSAAMFAPWDDNGDGTIDVDEMNLHRPAISAALRTGFDLFDETGVPGEVIFEDISVPAPHTHEDDGEPETAPTFVRATFRFRWERGPERVTVRYTFGALSPLRAVAVTDVVQADGSMQTLVSQATFDATATEAQLFAR